MSENSRERQKLLRELELLRDHHSTRKTTPNSDHLDNVGRLSVSSECSDLSLLETEFEYLKEILLRYLKGEHTEQLLKVVMAILKFSDREKAEIISKRIL